MFPPAVLSAAAPGGGTISWDCYIHRYIGGTAPDTFLTQALLVTPFAPGVTACPADIQPKASWIGNWAVRRSYAMIPPGKDYGTGVQIYAGQGYQLPVLTMGIGIYWVAAPVTDWDAPSYKSSAVKDASGTILLDEEPSGFNVSGSGWPCVSLGPVGTGGWGPLYQIDPNAIPQANSSSSQNQGAYTYRAHGNRFNYLFHDGHVSALSTNETLGSGTLLDPKGMWTVQPGD
jgi:prepilin-type processing-associated H-X9-DG protein